MKKDLLEEISRINNLIGGNFTIINESVFLRQEISKLKFNAKNAISHINDIQSLRLKTKAEGLADLNKIVDDIGDLIDDETRLSMKTTIKGSGVFKEIAEKLQKQIDEAVIAIEKLEGKIQDLYNQWNKLSIQMSSSIKNLTDEILGPVEVSIKEDIQKLKSPDPKIRNQFLKRYPTLQSWMKEYDDLVKAILEGEEGMFKAADDAPDAVKKEAQLAEENVRRYVNQILEDSGAREIYESIEDSRLITNMDGNPLPAGVDFQYKNILKKFRDRGVASLSDEEKEILDLVDDFKKSSSSQYDDAVEKLKTKIDDLEVKKPEGFTDVVMPSALKMMFKRISDPIYWAFVPYLRRWTVSIKYLLSDMSSSYDEFGETFFKKFNEALSRGQGTVKNTPADIARIVYKFQSAPEQFRSVFGNMLRRGGSDEIYKQIWDKFKTEGLDYFENAKNRYQTIDINGKPTEIDMYEEFKKYITDIEDFQSSHPILRNQKFPGLKFLLSECGVKDIESVVKKDMTEGSKVDISSVDKTYQTFKNVINTVKRMLLSNTVTQGIYNVIKSGFFGSPSKVDEFLKTRYGRDYLMRSRRWGSPSKVGTGAYLFFSSCARKFLLLPLIGAAITWIYDFVIGSVFDIKREDNPEKNYIFKEEEGGAFEGEVIANYVLYHVLTSVENPFRGSLKSMFDSISFEKASREDRGFFGEAEGNTWGFYLQDLISLVPGSGEDVIFWIYNNALYLNRGTETPEQKAEREYSEMAQSAIDEGFDNHEERLASQGDSLKNMYGEDPNSRKSEQNKNGWDEYWGNPDQTYNVGSLLEPDFYKDNQVKGVLKSMVEAGSLDKKTYSSIKDNRKLKWGLNPGFIGYYQNSAINLNKSSFISQLKKLKSDKKGEIFDNNEVFDLSKNLSQKIQNLFKNAEFNKESPFVYVNKDGKSFILIHNNKMAFNDPNKVQFYFPDYKTIYDALKNPKIMVVRDNYQLTNDDIKNGVTENNLLRVSVNPINTFTSKTSETIKTINNENTMLSKIKRIINEEAEKENFKMKDWDEIFTFQKIDSKNAGQFKDVEIKMRDVMDRIEHWRKRYKKECEENDERGDKGCDDGEDDSFVRAVIDTHPDVVRVLFTKGLAKLTTSDEKEKLEEGFASLLRIIREERNAEVEVWSVYRHKSSPDKIWSLVKGDFKQSEMESMGLGMQQSPKNSVEKKEDTLTSLKKKEHTAIESLKTNEKNGLGDLPRKLREKLNSKFEDGWTTEIPKKNLLDLYEKKSLNSTFNGDIDLYKIKSPEKFFSNLENKSSDIVISRGFCKTMVHAKKQHDLNTNQKRIFDHFVNKCNNKFEGNYSGLRYLSNK